MPTKKTTPAPTPPTPALQLINVDPTTLSVRDQAREDATPDAELIASVRQHGIIQPPIVEHATPAGTYNIVAGHRRVGAAITAGITSIPVIVRETPLDNAALTLEQQIVENERRKSLTAKDLATGYQKLTLFGLRPEDIAAGIGEKAERVHAALTTANSPAATAALAGGIDLEQAALIAEFDDDPTLQEHLTQVAVKQPQNFAREVTQRRFIRAADAKVNELREQAATENTPIVGEYGWTNDHWNGLPGRELDDRNGILLTKLDLDPTDHQQCPGHAAIISGASSAKTAELRYVCTDREANGHPRPGHAEPTSELTDEQRAEREQAETARRAHLEKIAARRAIVEANNRTRRTWIHGYLHSKLRPLASHIDVIAAATHTQMTYGEWWPESIVGELLTGNPEPRWSDETLVTAAFDDPAHPRLRLALATALAVLDRTPDDRRAVTYWTALESWGYTLTDTDREHQQDAHTAAEEFRNAQAVENLDTNPHDSDTDSELTDKDPTE